LIRIIRGNPKRGEMSENKRIYYLPGYAIGDKALKHDVKLAAQEMRDAIREAAAACSGTAAPINRMMTADSSNPVRQQ
jgi:hypothetical protein